MRLVADLADRPHDLTEANLFFVPANAGAVGCVVDLYVEDTGQCAQVLFVKPNAGRAADALQNQSCLALDGIGALHEAVLYGWMVEDHQSLQRLGHGALGRRRVSCTLFVIVRKACLVDSLRHRGASSTAHRLALTGHGCAKVAAGRDRQGAVKATRRVFLRAALLKVKRAVCIQVCRGKVDLDQASDVSIANNVAQAILGLCAARLHPNL